MQISDVDTELRTVTEVLLHDVGSEVDRQEDVAEALVGERRDDRLENRLVTNGEHRLRKVLGEWMETLAESSRHDHDGIRTILLADELVDRGNTLHRS